MIAQFFSCVVGIWYGLLFRNAFKAADSFFKLIEQLDCWVSRLRREAHIGNDFFAWFSSTESKSRINFLNCLSQGKTRLYTLNAGAIEYMAQNKLPTALLSKLENISIRMNNESDWRTWMEQHDIIKPRHRKIATEGALMGGLLAQGIPADFSIISDAGSRYFCESLFWASQPKQAAKT